MPSHRRLERRCPRIAELCSACEEAKNRGIARGSSLHCRSLRLTMDRRARGAPACFVCDLAAEKRESVLGR